MNTQDEKNQNLPHQLPIGSILSNRYEIGRVIGQGGFGITYEGYDPVAAVKVAIKEYYPSGYANRSLEDNNISIVTKDLDIIAGGMEKFLEEARILAQCKDLSGIVNVRDFFKENGTAYIVMEYLEGIDLKHRIREKRFEPDEIINKMGPVFDALENLHEKGIVHRDISPDNIMLLDDGSMKLMDFGAAREVNFNDARSMSIVLKNGYAPVEQYRRKGLQGPWTDVYSLCATIYKCITGVTIEEALEREQKDLVKKPSELGIAIDENTEQCLMIGLNIKADDRFQSVTDLKKALNGELDLNLYHITDDDSTVLYDDEDKTVEYSDSVTVDEDIVTRKENLEGQRKNNKKINPIYATFFIVTIIFIAVFLVDRIKQNRADQIQTETDATTDTTGNENTSGDESADITGDTADDIQDNVTLNSISESEDMYFIELVPKDNFSLAGFSEAVEQIKERVNIICDGRDYYYSDSYQTIVIGIPKDIVQDTQYLDHLSSFYIANENNYSLMAIPYDNEEGSTTNLGISYKDIMAAEVVYGSIPGADISEAYYGDDSVPSSYPYLEVTLSDQFWDKNKDYLSSGLYYPEIVIFDKQSEGLYTWIEIDGYVTEDKKLAFFEDSEEYAYSLGYAPVKLMLLADNIKNKKLESSFSSEVLWNDIAWEDVDAADLKGQNQCNISDMPDDYLIVKYCINMNPDELTEGMQYEVFSNMEKRLDALGVKYSIGTNILSVSRSSYKYLYLALPYKHMGIYVADLLAIEDSTYSTEMCGGYYKISYDSSKSHISFPSYKDSKCLVIEYEDEYKKDIEDLTTFLISEGIDKLYLQIHNESICYMPLDAPVTDGVLGFTELTHPSEDTLWQWEFIQSVVNTKTSVQLNVQDSHFVHKNEFSDNTADVLEIQPVMDTDDLESMAQAINAETIVRYRESLEPNKMSTGELSGFYFELNLPTDESFGEMSVNNISEIMQQLDIKNNINGRYLYFLLTAEDDVTKENAMIRIERPYCKDIEVRDIHKENENTGNSQAFFDGLEKQHCKMYIDVSNGRMDNYSEEIIERIKEDSYLGSDIFEIIVK